jgi:hypothetical protein
MLPCKLRVFQIFVPITVVLYTLVCVRARACACVRALCVCVRCACACVCVLCVQQLCEFAVLTIHRHCASNDWCLLCTVLQCHIVRSPYDIVCLWWLCVWGGLNLFVMVQIPYDIVCLWWLCVWGGLNLFVVVQIPYDSVFVVVVCVCVWGS